MVLSESRAQEEPESRDVSLRDCLRDRWALVSSLRVCVFLGSA